MSAPNPAGNKSPAPPAAASSPKPAASSQYAVGAIPPFNYAAAAKKSKPSPAVISGQDATGYVNGSTGASSPTVPAASAMAAAAASGSQPSSPTSGSKKTSVQVDGVRVPASRVEEIRGAAGSDVAFGTAGDKNATLSSSPAAPPAFNNGAPKAFGTLPNTSAQSVPPATKAPINLHALFQGGGSSPGSAPAPAPAASPSPVPVPIERRSLATYDPQAQARSPGPSTSPLPHGAMHAAANPAAPSFVPRMAPPFVPQQQPGQAFSPPPAGFHMPPPQGAYGQPPQFIPQKGPSPQNIPNGGAPPPGPGFAPSSAGSRAGSYVGSPVLGGMPPRPPQPQGGRPSYGGPTSPRMQNVALPGQGMMYPPQMYPGAAYAPQYGAYNPYAQPYAGAFIQQGPGGPTPPSLATSGASTPSVGPHTPKPPASTIPTSPSTVHSALSPATPATPSFQSFSPQPQHASLPSRPNPAAAQFTPGGGIASALSASQNPSTPLRPLSISQAGVAEFKPSFDSPAFTPSPRRSAAIKIVNPKDRAPAASPAPAEKKDEAAPAPAPAAEEKKADEADAQAKAKEAEAAAAKADEDKKKAAADEAAAAEKKKADDEAAEAKRKADEEAAQKEKEKEQAAAKAAEEAKAKEEQAAAPVEAPKPAAVADLQADESATNSAVSTPREEIEGLEVKASQAQAVLAEEAALLADEKVATEAKDPQQALEEARETLHATGSVPTATTPVAAPASLPAKPAGDAAPAASTAAEAKTGPSTAQIDAATAITDLDGVSYPEGAKRPQADLNANAEPGKYRYDRDFLLQFMQVCQAKPDSLPNLADIGMVDDGGMAQRGGSHGGRNRTMGPPSGPSRSGSTFGRSASMGGVGGFGGAMGAFGQSGPMGRTSEERFAQSLARSQSGAFGGQRGSMSRTTSQSGMGGAFTSGGGGRIKSERGSKRRDKGPPGERDESRKPGQHVAGDGFEGATLAPRSETGWAPSVIAGASQADANSPEMVQRKVKALLNKLTLERFDSISNQILEWANKSVDETDGRILRQVIALIFEKATDEATWSEMYARLCRKLMEQVSTSVKDETVKMADGTPVAGGALFRKYLLTRCQEDYEQGWKNKEAASLAAKNKEADDKAKQEANDAAKKEAEESGKEPTKEAELLSDEYYASQKAKRRGLGLVRFIGELYRLSMLTERIMHECIKKLLANTENPEEEDIESLCRLLTTVGKGLDNPKAKQHMDVYFSRMNTIANNPKVSSRMRFMILDVVDLRSARWASKQAAAGPKTISEIHADAQKAAEDSARRVASSGGKLPRLGDQLSRPNSRRGQGRDFGVAQPGADGWTTQPQRPAKAGDLSGFGRVRDSAPSGGLTFGPTGAFARAAKQKKEEARPATPSNPFALLSGGGDSEEPSEAPQRPRLQLKPRTVPLEGEGDEEKKDDEEEKEEDEDDGAIDPNASSLSRAEAERRAKNSVAEWFEIKNITEGVASVEALPKEFRHLVIQFIAESALTRKADIVNLTKDLFSQIAAKELLSHDELVGAFEPVFKTLADTAIDAPGAHGFAASLLVGISATDEDIERLKGVMESDDGEEEVEYARESFTKAYIKVTAA
ncbi:uncharacterized protein JCM10292_003925 [Rhodotorula paludigena]|uniref:uncharacterized protein n=1 Tax=Rhodotorula paludigena TaxID=86838 RepID=UPI00317F28B6